MAATSQGNFCNPIAVEGENVEEKDVSLWKSGRYAMENKGKFVIFNHEKFKELTLKKNGEVKKIKAPPDRKGTNIDAEKMKKIAENMGFEVDPFKDLPKHILLQKIEEYAKNPDLEKASCIVFVFLTHGESNENLCACDGVYNVMTDVMEKFKKGNCPFLENKPKVFIIQACRGDEMSVGIARNIEMQKSKSNLEENEIERAKRNCFSLSIEEDFLVAHATYTNQKAFRIKDRGSYFISSLQSKWSESSELSFMQILTKVNVDVIIEKINNGRKQMPSITSQLTKELYFPSVNNGQSATTSGDPPHYNCDGGNVYIFFNEDCHEEDDKTWFTNHLESFGKSYKIKEYAMKSLEQFEIDLKTCAEEDHKGAIICLFLCDNEDNEGLRIKDNHIVRREEIIRGFDVEQSMKGNPRIFLFRDYDWEECDNGSCSTNVQNLPLEADTLAVHTISEKRWNLDHQHPRKSLFIELLCENLKLYGKDLDFIQILTKVNMGMKEKKSKEIPCIVSQLTKRFFFYEQNKSFSPSA